VQVGDLVIRKFNGEIGIIVSKVRVNTAIYFWVYVSIDNRTQIFPSEMLEVLHGGG